MTDAPIDTAVFDALAETTGAEFAAELVTTFLDEAPGMITDLKTAAAQQTPDPFRRAAHSIKSNAEVFGAHLLAALARDLELSGLPASGEQLAALDQAYVDVAATLREMIDG
ncbi:MAG: Hpt domain-containing protein [Sedimentitalea sp.]